MREATKEDLPKGRREAQCPICWRMFTSDSACEAHKPYRKPPSTTCKDPAARVMVAQERRGFAVWGTQMSPDAVDRLKSLRPERS